MSTYETYKFDEDPNWRICLEDALIPQNPNYFNALYKLKQKYYKRKIDPNYEIKEYTSPVNSSNSNSTDNSNNTNTNTTNTNTNATHQRNTNTTQSTSSPRTTSTNNNSGTRNNNSSNSAFSKFLMISWIISQVSVLVFSILYLLTSPYHFYRAILAGLIGYLVSLFPVFEGLMPISKEKLLQLVQNDNVHYLLYCLMFYYLGVPSFIALLPNFIYALYHLLGRAIQLPRIRQIPALLSKLQLVESKKSLAIEYATRFEVYLFFYLLLGLFTRQASIFLLFNYYQFMKLRYQNSASTRSYFSQISSVVDHYVVNNQSVPVPIRTFVGKIKSYL